MNASRDLEAGILSACLRSDGQLREVRSTGLEPADFYTPQLGRLYALLCERSRQGRPTDLPSVLLAVQASHADPLTRARLPSVDEVIELPDRPHRGSKGWAESVAEDARRRRLAALLDEAKDRLTVGGLPVADVLSHLRDGTRTQRVHAPSGEDTSLWAGLRSVVDDNERATFPAEGEPPPPKPVMYGYHDLDQLIGGALPGDFHVLAGRTSMGKTQLAVGIAQNVAAAGRRVVVYSLEDPSKGFARRVLAMESGVPVRAMRMLNMTPNQVAAIQQAEGRLVERGIAENLHVVDAAGWTVMRIEGDLQTRRDRGEPAELVIIDYVQLIKSTRPAESESRRLAEVTADAVALGGTAQAPVLMCAQVNRDPTKRKDPRPLLNDLKGSGSLEEAPDVVMFVHRQGYYEPGGGPGSDGDGEVIVAKNRHNVTGIAPMRFERGIWREA